MAGAPGGEEPRGSARGSVEACATIRCAVFMGSAVRCRACPGPFGVRPEVKREIGVDLASACEAFARVGVPELHPHAFRHSCGVELLRRSNGNLRAVQEHLRHADIQTTTIYTRLTQSDLQKVVSAFDKNNGGENRDSHPGPHGT